MNDSWRKVPEIQAMLTTVGCVCTQEKKRLLGKNGQILREILFKGQETIILP